MLSEEQRRSMKEMAERFHSGEVDEIEVEVGEGKTMRMVRDADAPMGMRMEWPDGQGFDLPNIQAFPPSDEPHEELPDSIPFLRNTRIIITPLPGPRNAFIANYIRKAPWEGDVDALRADMEANGWEGGESDPPEHAEKYRAEWEALSMRKPEHAERYEEARAAYEAAPKDHFEYVRGGRKRTLVVTAYEEASTFVLSEADVPSDDV